VLVGGENFAWAAERVTLFKNTIVIGAPSISWAAVNSTIAVAIRVCFPSVAWAAGFFRIALAKLVSFPSVKFAAICVITFAFATAQRILSPGLIRTAFKLNWAFSAQLVGLPGVSGAARNE
jgi:hypothetical protein